MSIIRWWKNRHRHEWEYKHTLMGHELRRCRTCDAFEVVGL